MQCDATLIVRVLDRDTDLPIPGIRVSVRPVNPSSTPVHVQEVATATAKLGEAPLTGDDGRAVIALPSGAAFRANAREKQGAGASVVIEVSALRAGEHREVTVKLADRDELRIHGEVLADVDRVPVSKARVRVCRDRDRIMREGADAVVTPAPEVLADTETDATGRFEVVLESWKQAYLRVEKPGFAVTMTPVDVVDPASEDTFVMFLRSGARIRAHVLGPDGTNLAGAEVRVWAKGKNMLRDPRTSIVLLGHADEVWSAKTATDGRCELVDLVPGESLSFEIRVGANVVHDAANAIVLYPGEARDVEWRVGERCRLCGTFVDQHGDAVRAHPVWIMRADTDRPRRFHLGDERDVFASATTDERGAFCFDAVPPGKWWIGPAVSMHAPARAPEDSVVALAELVEIADGTREATCVVHLSRGLFLRGRVVNPEGEAAPNVALEARRLGAATLEPGKSGTDGSFVLGPLLPESFDVVAKGVGLFANSEPVRATAGDEGLVLRLRRAGVISGSVVDASTGEVCAASVTLTGDPSGTEHIQRGSSGDSIGFRFDGLVPGTYDLFAHTSGDRVDVRVGLLRGVAVDGGREVRDLVVRVDAGATLELSYTGPRKFAIAEIKSGSASIFRGSVRARRISPLSVPAGSFEVALMNLDGEVVQVRQVDVASGETKAVELNDTP